MHILLKIAQSAQFLLHTYNGITLQMSGKHQVLFVTGFCFCTFKIFSTRKFTEHNQKLYITWIKVKMLRQLMAMFLLFCVIHVHVSDGRQQQNENKCELLIVCLCILCLNLSMCVCVYASVFVYIYEHVMNIIVYLCV